MELFTGENDAGRRLDRILRKALQSYPLPLIHRLLRQKQVIVDGKAGRAQDRVDSGVKIEILSLKDEDLCGKSSRRQKKKVNTLPAPDIIWEGEGLLAVNKPCGIAVHGDNCSLDAAVRSYLDGRLPVSLSFKPGPLHRLDKPSSGIVVFSASLEGARLFTSLLLEQKVQKIYLAIVEGAIKNEKTWQDRLVRDSGKKKTFVINEQSAANISVKNRGKTAAAKVMPLAFEGGYSLVKIQIITGRTHQIRAQAAAAGHPLLGDVKYGAKSGRPLTTNKEKRTKKKKQIPVFFLHAWKLEFLEYSIEAPLPAAFREKLLELFKNFSF